VSHEWCHFDLGANSDTFRRLWKTRIGEGLSPAAVGAIVQQRTAKAKLEGGFGGRSLRSGFITEGGRRGVALPALMAMTEHRAVATSVIGYFQAGGVADNPAARLLATMSTDDFYRCQGCSCRVTKRHRAMGCPTGQKIARLKHRKINCLNTSGQPIARCP